uniref:unspecific monooxygenase n=1 Tax=Helicoverpa armigera TaxID=29058 RepID=A0A9E9G969_HELAM|nr:cytochrome P450 CYP321A1v2 [Helicoverpa armigera]
MLQLPLILFGLVLLLTWYLIGRHNENYWKARGVKFYSKNKVIGPSWDYLFTKGAMFEKFGELYKAYRNEPVVAIGQILTPSLFVIDAKNVQHVLSSDFQSFNHRGLDSVEGDQLTESITLLNGPKWKLMRKTTTPLFTSSKLKNMYYIMDKCAQDFVTYLKRDPKLWKGNFFDSAMLYCNAAVCAAIFGIGEQSTFDSPFLKFAKDVSISSFKNNMKFTFFTLAPKLFTMLGLKVFKEHEDFFVGAIGDVIKQREEENVKRHDFADLCVQLQKNGTLKDQATGYELEPTTGLLSAQAFFFFTAGVEPAADGIFATFALLSQHPEILQKVHQEIDEYFEKYDGKITYDVVCDMEYVDKVLSESLRMFPPIGFLTRQCIHDTVLPVGNVKVAKGTKLFTPIYEIHHDPKYYPDPEVFDPERFSKERRSNDDLYMPFGMGNRTCIGARYSKLQLLAAIVHVLRSFTLKPIPESQQKKVTFLRHAIGVRIGNVKVELIPRDTK